MILEIGSDSIFALLNGDTMLKTLLFEFGIF